MSPKHDSDWEVVDELPGEKKPKPSKGGSVSVFKNKSLWIGVLAGAALVILVPVFRVLLLNLIRAWWLWLGLALYWVWRRTKQAADRANRRK